MIRAISPIVALAFALAAGCGGSSSSYTIPAGSELKPFQPPAEDELADDDDGWDLSADEDEADEADAEASDVEAEADAPEPADEPAPAAAPKPITPDKKTPTVPTKER